MEKGKQSERIEAPEEDDRLLQSLSEACGSQIHRSTGPQVHRSTGKWRFSVSLRVLNDCANLHWKAYKIPESVLQDALQRAMQNQPLGYSIVDSAQIVH